MFLRELTEKRELNIFVTENKFGSFLQSWEWGEFQKSLGRRIWRVGVYNSIADDPATREANELLAAATIIEKRLGLGKSYLYAPYGPVYRTDLNSVQKEDCTRYILTKVRQITAATKNQEEIFFRLEPCLYPAEVGNFFVNQGLVKTTAVQPHDTEVVDLTEAESWLLKKMHPKTRYNIRLAERKGVKVRLARDQKDMEIFWRLMEKTSQRDNFHSHPKNYYENLWNFFRESDLPDQMHLTVVILLAEYQNKPLAASLLGFFGSRVTYLHGASDYQHRELMASHRLQWEGIKLGKANGYLLYDFWGVRPEQREIHKGSKEEKWAGVTRFKKSFGGREVNYVGTWDWVYEPRWYRIYQLGRKLL